MPVSDQDRAKQFYAGQLGFTEEIGSSFGDAMRWVMLRPPGSGTAITLVTWFESMPAGSMRGAVLGCDDQRLGPAAGQPGIPALGAC